MTCQTCGHQVDPDRACDRCGTPAGQPPVWPTVPTRTVAGVGTVACVLIALVALANVVTGVIDPLISRDLAQVAMETEAAELLVVAKLLSWALTLLAAPLIVAAIVVFLVWMWRAHKNLYAFPGVTPRMGAGWSIGGWFIPFANLVIPFMAMDEIARGSLPWKRRDPMRTGTHPLVGFWWAACVVSGCAAGVARAVGWLEARDLPTTLESPGDYQPYVDYYGGIAGRNVVAVVVQVAAAVLVIILVARISRAQTARLTRAHQLGRVSHVPGTPPPGPGAGAANAEAPAPGPGGPAAGPGTSS